MIIEMSSHKNRTTTALNINNNPMSRLKVSNVEKKNQHIYVDAEIIDGKKTILKKRKYPLDSSEKDIEKDLEKCLKLHDSEKESKKKNEERDRIDAKSGKTVEQLKSLIIK